MVATLLAVRIRSQLAMLRSNIWSAIGMGVLALFMLPGLVIVVVALFWLSSLPDLRPDATVLAGSLLVVVWLIGSVVFFAMDDSVAPGRLCLLPLRARDLALPLALSDLVTLPGIATLLVSIGLIGAWASGLIVLLSGVMATCIGVLIGIIAGRITVTALSAVLANRRSRDALYIFVVLAVTVAALLPSFLMDADSAVLLELRVDMVHSLVSVLEWTPLGVAWAFPAAVAKGAWLLAAVRLLLALAYLAALYGLWSWQLGRALTSPLPSAGSSRTQGSWRWIDRIFPHSPAGALATRILRYLRRDPRRFIALVMVTMMPTVLVLINRATSEGGVDGFVPWLGVAALAWLAGINGLQDTAYDGSALWTHAVAGISGRDDRLGRLMGNGLLYTVALTITALLIAGLADRWSLLPALIGLGLAALYASMGVGLLVSSFLNGTLPPPGSNPFATSTKGQGSAFLGSVLHGMGMLVITAPCLLVVLALDDSPWLGWVLLLVGPAVGAGAALGLCHLGGRHIDVHWPELVHSVTYEK